MQPLDLRGHRERHVRTEQFGTTRGSPRRSRTAKAFGISRTAAKSERACEWGGGGRLSDDGLGQNNPNRSEDPWGAGCPRPDFAVSVWPPFPDSEPGQNDWSTNTSDGDKLKRLPHQPLRVPSSLRVQWQVHWPDTEGEVVRAQRSRPACQPAHTCCSWTVGTAFTTAKR